VPSNPVPGAGRAPAQRTQADPFAVRTANNGAGSADDFSFDATGTTSGGFGFPVGVWPARLKRVERTIASTGKPMFVWYFDGIIGTTRGRAGRLYTVLFPEPEKNWAAAQVCESLELGSVGGAIRFTREEAEGRFCAVVVEEQEGRDGVTRPQITKTLHWSSFADDPEFVEAAERYGLNGAQEGVPS
jgi:hypothetical protein